jgi:hypothetical protein
MLCFVVALRDGVALRVSGHRHVAEALADLGSDV